MIFYILIFLNILIFLLEFHFGNRIFIQYFALYPGSEFYTYLTYAFLHSDFEHLLMNMAMLFMLSQLLKFHNKFHIFAVYFLGAIISALMFNYYMMKTANYNYFLLGASGAICALMGYAGYILKQPGFFVAIVLTSLISAVLFSNVAWQAHIFGALFGIAYAIILRRIK